MGKINCVGCKWLMSDRFRDIQYCQMTKSYCHREELGEETIYSPIVPDDGECPGWVTEIAKSGNSKS